MSYTKKEKSCLVTQGLINAIDWFLTAPESIIKDEKGGDGKTTWKEKAHLDLCNTIRRVKTPFPEPARRGVEFEKKVYEVVTKFEKDGIEIGGSELFQEVCESVKGYKFYQKGGVYKEIAGNNCYLYGKYDGIKEDKTFIKDIKTTGNYSKNKYLKTFQHKIYCYMSGASNFEYVIAEWYDYPKLKAIYYEEFKVTDKKLLENEVIHTIEDAFDTIKDLDLWEDYKNKFCLY